MPSNVQCGSASGGTLVVDREECPAGQSPMLIERDSADGVTAGYGPCRSCSCNNFSGVSSWCSHIGCAHHHSAHR